MKKNTSLRRLEINAEEKVYTGCFKTLGHNCRR